MSERVPTVCVIVVAYDSGAHLGRCVAALARQSWRDFEAVIFDNASRDGALDALGPLPEGFHIVRSKRNLGFAGGNNRAATETRAPWIATLNPDAFPEPDWLARLMAATARYPDVDMFGSTQLLADDPSRLDGAGDVYHASGIHWRGLHGQPAALLPPEGEVFAPCAAAALYRARAFHAHGGFDERFFCFSEDMDLAFRIRLAGGRCIQVADALVHHVGSSSTGRGSAFSVRYGVRNRLWAFVKNMPGPLLWPLLPVHIAANLVALAVAVARGRGRHAWQGLREAVIGIGPIWRARRELRHQRRVSAWRIARVIAWSPFAPFRRAAHVLPVSPRVDACPGGRVDPAR
ncbi:MAG: glycosyltransferase family 2 protein [Kiloniellaceae bacterium]